jgi:hypothetical protein
MDFIEAYRKAMKLDMQAQGEGIVNGRCESYESYRYQIGIILGMQRSLDRFEDIVKKYVLETEDRD